MTTHALNPLGCGRSVVLVLFGRFTTLLSARAESSDLLARTSGMGDAGLA